MKVISSSFRVTAAPLLVCAALGVSSAHSDLAFTGTVFAVPGGNVKGTAMVACLLEGRECNQNGSGTMIIEDTGQSAVFDLRALKPQPYWLLAWRDLNNDAEVNKGDEVAVYAQAGKPALLTPPAERLELRLEAFTGDFDALLPQASSAPAVPPLPPHRRK